MRLTFFCITMVGPFHLPSSHQTGVFSCENIIYKWSQINWFFFSSRNWFETNIFFNYSSQYNYIFFSISLSTIETHIFCCKSKNHMTFAVYISCLKVVIILISLVILLYYHGTFIIWWYFKNMRANYLPCWC